MKTLKQLRKQLREFEVKNCRKIIRVFPQRTSYTPNDEMVFIGYPELFRLAAEEVHISCLFTWDIPLCKKLAHAWSGYYKNVKLGGPAFNDRGNGFTPGLYTKKGVTITHRGCIRNCSFCFVPKREGKIRLLEIHKGNIIQDNNLLACPRPHIEKVFEMLKNQKGIEFRGGLDCRLLKKWHVNEFKKLSIAEFWFAADYLKLDYLEKVKDLMSDFSRNKKRCYVLVGYKNETIKCAEKRLKRVWEYGFLPFAQFYRGKGEQTKTKEWAQFLKLWCRPAATKTINKTHSGHLAGLRSREMKYENFYE
ncbi:hypothetical protein KY312_02105 [Candidatus Woesearchaeota archaeon]|nr:hypothetical protein [Candidatus Woesearchaeota archaeon]